MVFLLRLPIVLFILLGPGAASAAFDLEVIDATGDAGDLNNLALDADGNPHVLYTRDGVSCSPWPNPRGVVYARKEAGTWILETIPGSPCFVRDVAIVIDGNGEPRILIEGWQYDLQSHIYTIDLVYGERAGGIWTMETIETNQGTQIYAFNDPRIVLDALDVPRVSYGDVNPSALKYASRAGGTWTIEVVDATSSAGGYTDLSLDPAGNPCISYYVYTGEVLRFASLSAGIWTIEEIESSIDLFGCTSLQVDSNAIPHVAYARPGGDLAYGTRTGGEWTIVTVPVSEGVPSADIELALDSQENPHILFQDRTLQSIRYAFRTGGNWYLQDLDSGPAGDRSSVAIGANDLSHVTFYNTANLDLMYATNQVLANVPSGFGPERTGFQVALYPNPSRGELNVSLELAGMADASMAQRARVDLIRIGGERLCTLAPRSIDASTITFGWDGRLGPHDLAAGVYRLAVRLDGEPVATRPWVYLRSSDR